MPRHMVPRSPWKTTRSDDRFNFGVGDGERGFAFIATGHVNYGHLLFVLNAVAGLLTANGGKVRLADVGTSRSEGPV